MGPTDQPCTQASTPVDMSRWSRGSSTELCLVISQVSGSGIEGQNRKRKYGGGEGAGGAVAEGVQLSRLEGERVHQMCLASAVLCPSPACAELPSSLARMDPEEFSGLALGHQGILNNSQNSHGSAPNLHELEPFCKSSA